jgi:soluble lytic murein transglycosylase-like protein
MRNRAALVVALGAALLAPTMAKAMEPTQMQQRAVMALEQLARNGSARATYELGRRYETGVGVAASPRRAFELYCEAATAGHGPAAHALARIYLNGQGVAASPRHAVAWAEKAESLGHPFAREITATLAGVKPAPNPSCKTVATVAGPVVITPPKEIARLVRKLAPEHGLDPELVLAVIHAESGFRVDAASPKNAYGLMQLIPETAERFGVRNVFDPADNIRGGMRYLSWLLSHFEGDVQLTLAAYNAGEGAVARHGGVPPYRETQDYVAKILSIYPRARHPFDGRAAKRTARAPATELVATN